MALKLKYQKLKTDERTVSFTVLHLIIDTFTIIIKQITLSGFC